MRAQWCALESEIFRRKTQRPHLQTFISARLRRLIRRANFRHKRFAAQRNFIQPVVSVYNESMSRTKFAQRPRHWLYPFFVNHSHNLRRRPSRICQRAKQIKNCVTAEQFPRRCGMTRSRMRRPRKKKSHSDFQNCFAGFFRGNFHANAQRFQHIGRSAARS